MPRISPKVLDSVGYLFESAAAAEAGESAGGSAFLVSIDAPLPGRVFTYAVTNWHVAVGGGASVLRINTHSGRPEIFDWGPEDWFFDPRYDIAVKLLSGLRQETHKFAMVPSEGFATKAVVDRLRIGPGEDVFMVGRFVDHDGGGLINAPAVRFGNISVMPTPQEQPDGLPRAPAYIIDMHSRTGYSGSPVFVFRTPGSDLELPGTLTVQRALTTAHTMFAFLGMHMSQFPEEWEVKKRRPKKGYKITRNAASVPRTGEYIKGFSGMTLVLPGDLILEVLNSPAVKNDRDEKAARVMEAMAKKGPTLPEPESSAPAAEIVELRDAALKHALHTPPKKRPSNKKKAAG